MKSPDRVIELDRVPRIVLTPEPVDAASQLLYSITRLSLGTTLPTEAECGLIQLMQKILRRSGPLQEIGRGGDMAAYSNPGLPLVAKFPHDDYHIDTEPIPVPFHLAKSYTLAKEKLGGIFAPSLDVPAVFVRRREGMISPTVIVFQKRVVIVSDLLAQTPSEVLKRAIKQQFIGITYQMWERGIFDSDPNWEENYGIDTHNGSLLLIDAGDLSDDPEEFPEYEGLSRIRLYDRDLRDTFRLENFRSRFGTNPQAATYSPMA